MSYATFLEFSAAILLQVGIKTGNLEQGKWVEVWKAVSLVVEQSAIRRCDLTSNSPETAVWKFRTDLPALRPARQLYLDFPWLFYVQFVQ